ncbi:MAG: hypothetical protein LBQ73_07665 [Tannerellaceae bacterium]|jgi:hypothetical protein|nr:hypothetical protein [Tannerellaceae bacterium]
MANPIEPTPVITGEDAKQFRKHVSDAIRNADKKTSPQEIARREKNYKRMVSISGGTFS